MGAAASLVAPDCEERARDAVGLEGGGDTSGRGRRLWSRFDGCVRVQAFFSAARGPGTGTPYAESNLGLDAPLTRSLKLKGAVAPRPNSSSLGMVLNLDVVMVLRFEARVEYAAAVGSGRALAILAGWRGGAGAREVRRSFLVSLF